ncbi:1-acyl-sn-glycerol-3-phosphate acyltransferase [Cellulomonas sp. KRMCY2]|uniref:1-acyl-sn-glycerol-3-phosphate acyltransferase n=1 Tax=Cellulomonas sp. KRMCY2 TaxID=1304865 RepID=UPI00045E6E55|nr:1-acyl-sn-glycerol-3-phosphate acyltransferase [Cellulomonas sp. KRMCY2]
MPLPPLWIRRLVSGPLLVLLTALLVATLPLWLIIAAAASPLVKGWLRPLRLVWMCTVYLVWDATALVALFVLWVASGLGRQIHTSRFIRAHYLLTGWFLRVLFHQVRWAVKLRIDVVGELLDSAAPDRPVIVASWHAGPGDSFVLIHALINWFAREPRIVLKSTLQWDPAVDVMLNRPPNTFIAPATPWSRSRPRAVRPWSHEVAALAAGLDGNDALVIFPEGGNFSPHRRRRAIERLRAAGLHRMADRAEAMRHVIAPRPGGLLAAIDAAPDAGVVFIAHTGLERMVTVGDVWRELPMDKRIVMRHWFVPPQEIPTDREERIEWLYEWWARIDAWIGENQPIDVGR